MGDEVYKRAAAFMHARTVAIWGHHEEHTKGEPRQYGTGVLLQIADVRFILTAEHVAALFLEHGVSLFVGAASERLFPISKAHVRHSKKGDIAAIVLTEEDAAKIGAEKRFTRVPDVSCGDPTASIGGIYGVFGYPSATSDVDHGAQMMTMVGQPCFGVPFAEGTGLTKDFDSRIHIAINFDSNTNAHPGGMSGGGIWRVLQAGARPEQWTEEDVKLVAIEHTLGRDHTSLVGTRIEYVFGLIRSFDATLERAFNLQWPARILTQPARLVIEPPKAIDSEER